MAIIPNLLCTWFNVWKNANFKNGHKLIVACIFLQIFLLASIIPIIFIDTQYVPTLVFCLLVGIVFLINICMSLYQNTFYGIVGQLDCKYMVATLIGTNISGILVTLLKLATRVIFSNIQIDTCVFLFMCIVLLLFIASFFYFYLFTISTTRETFMYINESELINSNPSKLFLALKIKIHLCNIFTTICITLIVFPTLLTKIKPKVWFGDDEIFTLIVVLLNFNVSASLGNIISIRIRKIYRSLLSDEIFTILVVARLLFIPIFFHCNYGDNKDVSLGDITTTILIFLFGLTHGCYLSIANINATRSFGLAKYCKIAGMLCGLATVSGVFNGICISFIWR